MIIRHHYQLFLEGIRKNALAHAISLVLSSFFSADVLADTNVLVTGGVGIDTSETRNGATVKLGAALTTAVQAGAAESITFESGRIESSATTAALSRGQTGLQAKDGGQISVGDSSVVLDPRTAAGAAITASDLTGLIAEAGGSISLTDSDVLVGGGAKGTNNRGFVVTGDGSVLAMSGGSLSTVSWGAVGISVENGGSASLSKGASVSTSGARSTTGGAHGLRVTGSGSELVGDSISVTTTGGSAYGVRVDDGASVSLTDSSISTAGGNGHGVLADGALTRAEISGGEISTTGKGSVGVWARNGAQALLDGSEIRTSGAAVSAATPVDDEKTLSLSHGLLATGAGTRIDADAVTLHIGGGSASAARAEDGARIVLSDSTIDVSSSATTTTTTAALHALGGGKIEGSGLDLVASGTNVGGARAEGTGSSVTLRDSSVLVDGAGSVANPAAGARAMGGGGVVVENSRLTTHGLTYGHGVSIEGAGSTGTVSDTTISVDGNRSIGMNITGGATGTLRNSSISVDAQAGAVGPWSPGVLVDGAGSTLQMSDTDVHTSQQSSYGVQAKTGADISIANGRISTAGNYSAGVAAANATVTMNNAIVETAGNENAMGIVADIGATVTVHGGSVITTGNGNPVQSNLTFPHGLVSRNPGALLVADGTSVLTKGTQAYGAAVDDGGSMILRNLAVKTEGDYSRGIYAGIGYAKPGTVSLTANNITVQTFGDYADGALTSRLYKPETATLDLTNASVTTHGMQSHGLRAESGAALTAGNTVVSTSGDGSLGVLANNTATAALDVVGVSTSGALAHGVVAKQGGSVDATGVVVHASGDQSAALYVQGTETSPGSVRFTNASLGNRDGATIATAGVADIELENVIAGGSGQWLNVDRSVASDGTATPDFGTGQWQGVGQSLDSDGRASINLASSVVTGSASTAAGSTSDVTMQGTSIWNMTGDSNLTTLRNGASLIDFSAPVGNRYKNLTVNSYHGVNGTIALNTYLYTDDSPSDKLVIDGGTASGSTNLLIRNAGGPGALTTGNGIMVVDAVNGGTTETEAFRLLNRVKAGPYEYTLYRASLDNSNGEAWYLRSTNDVVVPDPVDPDPVNPDPDPVDPDPVNPDPDPVDPGPVNPNPDPVDPGPVNPNPDPVDPGPVDPNPDPVDPGPVNPAPDPVNPDPVTPNPQPRQVPNYRAETSLYSAIPAMALSYSRAMVDTLHERVGEERRNASEPLPAEEQDSYGPSLGWGRLIYRKGSDSLPSGADYDYRIQAFQVGTDLYRNEDTDGSTDQAGLSLQAGRITGSVGHTDGKNAGDDMLRSYGIGAYWTHFGPEGWYLDGVLQFNRFSIDAKPAETKGFKTKGRGVTASLEGGYPFQASKDKNLHIEPQAQVIVSKIRIDDTHDGGADVRFEDVDSLTGRLGVRIDKDWFRTDDKGKTHRTSAWVRPSVWHEFKGKAKTEFSSADGYIPFGTDMSGTWGELNLGVDYQHNERTTITGSLGYQKGFGSDSRSYEGMIGIKINF